MEIIKKRSQYKLSAKTRTFIFDFICYLFVILFIYTAVSKFMTFHTFERVLGKSPLLGNYKTFIAWSIPVVEIAIGLILNIEGIKKLGLYMAFWLMVLFTVYLSYMVAFSPRLPCHCGGVIGSMSWEQHIWFNIGFIILALSGLTLKK